MTTVLYAVLVVVGLVDIWLVTPAIREAHTSNVVGRLLATLATLTGLVVGAGGRLLQPPPLNALTAVGLSLIDAGLIGYALFLPSTGVRSRVRSTLRRRG